MNGSLKTLVSIHLALFIATALFGQNKGKKAVPISFPFTEKHWSAKTDNVAFVDHKSTMAVKSSNDEGFEILLKDFDFSVGTIEFDVELKGRGFPGIKFHVDETTGNSETFYLRYFGTLNPISRNTTQYAAVIDGVNLWDITDDYQAAARILENEWNHIKMVISENQMKVYVNNMESATLHVPVLEGLTKSGKISLSGDVIYANMKITPNATENLPQVAGYDPTSNDPNYLRNWQFLEPIAFPMGKDVMKQIDTSPGVVIDEAYFDASKGWKPITAEHRAMVNLTKAFGGTERNSRRLTWLKTSITSDKELEKLLKLGFSDEVWVFINGQPLYQDKNYYGSPGMKEPRGRCTIDNTSLRIPLVEGENEILIGLTSYFFGWGLVARWDDTSGLRY